MSNVDKLANDLKEVLGDNLKSVLIYGSAASDDQTAYYSDVNVLVVARELGIATLKLVGPLLKAWVSEKQPLPLLFTEVRLTQAADVFPIEYLDILDKRKVVTGEDPFGSVHVDTRNLRHQLEYELRGKLIQLRTQYVASFQKPKEVRDLLARAASTFVVLFRGVVRLSGAPVPERKADVIPALGANVKIDVDALSALWGLRESKEKMSPERLDTLATALFAAVENTIDYVDQFQNQSTLGVSHE